VFNRYMENWNFNSYRPSSFNRGYSPYSMNSGFRSFECGSSYNNLFSAFGSGESGFNTSPFNALERLFQQHSYFGYSGSGSSTSGSSGSTTSTGGSTTTSGSGSSTSSGSSSSMGGSPSPDINNAFPVSDPGSFAQVNQFYNTATTQQKASYIQNMLETVTQKAIAQSGNNLDSSQLANIQTTINQLVQNSASDTTPLSQYEAGESGNDNDPGELSVDARLASHEQQLDGSQEPNGAGGTIYLQTLLNGQNNGQASVFLSSPQMDDYFVRSMLRSYNPATGQLNGTGEKDAVADSYLQGTGVSIQSELNQVPTQTASDNPNIIFEQVADPSQGANYLPTLEQQSGWNDQQVMADALWGHDQFENVQINNTNTQSFLQNADSNTNDQQDYPLVHLDNDTATFVSNLMNSPTAGNQLNQDFLNLMAQSFGNPNIANPQT